MTEAERIRAYLLAVELDPEPGLGAKAESAEGLALRAARTIVRLRADLEEARGRIPAVAHDTEDTL